MQNTETMHTRDFLRAYLSNWASMSITLYQTLFLLLQESHKGAFLVLCYSLFIWMTYQSSKLLATYLRWWHQMQQGNHLLSWQLSLAIWYKCHPQLEQNFSTIILLHDTKTSFVCFCNYHNVHCDCEYLINNSRIQAYWGLGVTFSSDLTCSVHTESCHQIFWQKNCPPG